MVILKYNNYNTLICDFILIKIIFKGSWFENYLSTIKPLDSNEVLQTVLLILDKIKKVANDQSMPFSRGNIML